MKFIILYYYATRRSSTPSVRPSASRTACSRRRPATSHGSSATRYFGRCYNNN